VLRPLPLLLAIALWATPFACTGPSPSDAGPDDADAGPEPGSHLPAQWTLQATGIRVDVQRRPFAVTVRNADGVEVLRSLGAGHGDGFGTLGWTSGTIRLTPNGVNRGYFAFSKRLDPWRDDWVVVDATVRDRELELQFRGEGGRGAERMTVRQTLRDATLRVEARLETTQPRAWEVAFATTETEGFLGFGERFNRTNQRGIDVFCWAEEGGIGRGEGAIAGPMNPFPSGQAMSYYPVPFFISTRGYGFWMDTTYRSEFNLATERPDAWRAWHVGRTLAYEIYLPVSTDPRPAPMQILDRFTATVGRPMIPPAWTLGPRRRVGRGSIRDGVPEIQAMRDRDLAITSVDDALHFLPGGSHLGRETELRAWVQAGARLGYRINGYYNSLLDTSTAVPIHDLVVQAIANRWVLFSSNGMPSEVFLISGRPVTVLQVDFGSPDATRWYQSTFQWATSLGYSGWMYDFGEYVQPDVVSANGMNGEELHNLYPVLYQRAVFDEMERSPMRGEWLAFPRSGYTGAWQYTPMVWSGDPAASFEDSDGLPSMVRGGVNMGVSGVPHWGGDIGGFHCLVNGHVAADGELITRWIQQGSMSSNMQDQDACSGALDPGEKASIWSSTDAQRAWFTYARLHTRLFPYLYTLAHQAHATGAPTMRHVFLEHPDVGALAGVDDEYYFGPALLVAPVVTRGARVRDVTFPPGRFLDWLDERIYEGGRRVSVPAPLDKLPLFLRDGYLVPMLDPTIDTLADGVHPTVVGPAEVADVYDVVGLLSTRAGRAQFTLWDASMFSVQRTGPFAPPAFAQATNASELASCAECWLRDSVSPGLDRLRVSTRAHDVSAGGIALHSTSTRRIRWDIYLAE